MQLCSDPFSVYTTENLAFYMKQNDQCLSTCIESSKGVNSNSGW